MRNLDHRLRKKGWSEKEIAYSLDVMENAKLKKKKHLQVMEALIEFFIAIIIILATFVVSIFLIPLLIVVDSSLLFFFVIGFIGLTIGLLFEFMVKEMETFENRHHLMFSFLVPLIVIVNMIITVMISNKLIDQFMLVRPHQNAILISLVYTFFFLMPYVLTHIRWHRERKHIGRQKKMG